MDHLAVTTSQKKAVENRTTPTIHSVDRDTMDGLEGV